MTKKHTLAGLLLLVAGSLIFVACSSPQGTPAAATLDPNVIYTQAAETVQAGIAQTAAANPTTPPTATIAPTNTIDPAIAAALTQTAQAVLQPGAATATLAPGQPTRTLAAGVNTPIVPAATLPVATSAVVAPPPKATGDKAELIAQSPNDGTNIPKSASFDVVLTLKNTGTTTWSTSYTLVYYAGDRMGSPKDFNMPHAVKPGETVKLNFAMKAPSSSGSKKIIWAVQNANAVNFYPLYMELNITD